jgi:quercetin dioxygenase-like cupin family protein
MLELWAWEMRPGERFEAQAHSAGTLELIHVLDGVLDLDIEGVRYIVEAGSSAHARTDRAHAYACAGPMVVRFTMVVFEPGNAHNSDY